MDKYIVVCYAEWENGVRKLPTIEYTEVAESEEKALENARKKYPKYKNISAWSLMDR